MKDAIGIDYDIFESGGIAFDYERMMRETGYTLKRYKKNSERNWCREHSCIRIKEFDKIS